LQPSMAFHMDETSQIGEVVARQEAASERLP